MQSQANQVSEQLLIKASNVQFRSHGRRLSLDLDTVGRVSAAIHYANYQLQGIVELTPLGMELVEFAIQVLTEVERGKNYE